MRTIVTGIIVFVLWSVLCTWFYLTHIKGPAADENAPVEQAVTEAAPAEPEPMVIEPETTVESPGSYTVYHQFDRSTIIPDPQLDSYIENLEAYKNETPGTRINVVGNTDYIGTEDYNYQLGLRRAGSTKDYLVKKGIPAEMITVSSKGETAPIATNSTDSGRARNRRTEIQITE